jgi:hypothetical protein
MASKIENYINRIKNPAKKEYAKKYYLYKLKRSTEHPGYTCSYMAAQAVRMDIDTLLKGK